MCRSIVIKLEESKEGIQRGYKLTHTSVEDTILNAAVGVLEGWGGGTLLLRPF